MKNFKQYTTEATSYMINEERYKRLKVILTSYPYNFQWVHNYLEGVRVNTVLAIRS